MPPLLPKLFLGCLLFFWVLDLSGKSGQLSGPTYCIAVTRSSPNMATGALQRPCCVSLTPSNQEALHVTLSYHLATSLRCDLPNILALCSFQVTCTGTLSCDTPLTKPFSNCCFFRITKRITQRLLVHSITLLCLYPTFLPFAVISPTCSLVLSVCPFLRITWNVDFSKRYLPH